MGNERAFRLGRIRRSTSRLMGRSVASEPVPVEVINRPTRFGRMARSFAEHVTSPRSQARRACSPARAAG